MLSSTTRITGSTELLKACRVGRITFKPHIRQHIPCCTTSAGGPHQLPNNDQNAPRTTKGILARAAQWCKRRPLVSFCHITRSSLHLVWRTGCQGSHATQVSHGNIHTALLSSANFRQLSRPLRWCSSFCSHSTLCGTSRAGRCRSGRPLGRLLPGGNSCADAGLVPVCIAWLRALSS